MMRSLVTALRHPDEHDWWKLRPWQRHSTVVAVAGLVYVGVGVVYACTEPTANRTAGLRWALDVMPLQAWGVVWITVGSLAIFSARWPPASKTWGYTALAGLALCWAAIYLVSIVLFDAPEQSMSGVFVWGLVAFMWWAIAGLSNPDDLTSIVDGHLGSTPAEEA